MKSVRLALDTIAATVTALSPLVLLAAVAFIVARALRWIP